MKHHKIKVPEAVMKIEHVALYVHDLEGARTFFMKYLGAKSNGGYHNPRTDFRSYFLSFDGGARLELMNTGLQTYFLRFPDSDTRLELMTRPQLTDSSERTLRTGFIHLAFSVGSREAVDRLTETLVAAGYPCLSGPRTTGDGYYESCILAIEQNQIEITV